MSDSSQDASDPPLTTLNQFDFHAQIGTLRGTALVLFTSEGCDGCRHLRLLMPEIRRLEPAWDLFEVDAQHEAGLTSEFEVFHLPAIFVFHAGRFQCRLESEANPGAIVAATHAALQRPPCEAP